MKPNINFYEERKDLAASFRWAERINLHEGVANHFSLAVNEDGTEFLMNPNMWHFSRIKASDLLLLNANDKSVCRRKILQMRLHGDCMELYIKIVNTQDVSCMFILYTQQS